MMQAAHFGHVVHHRPVSQSPSRPVHPHSARSSTSSKPAQAGPGTPQRGAASYPNTPSKSYGGQQSTAGTINRQLNFKNADSQASSSVQQQKPAAQPSIKQLQATIDDMARENRTLQAQLKMATEKAQMDLDISHAESDRKIAALVAKLRAQRMNLEQTKDGLGDITSEISELQTIFHELSQQMFSGDAQYSSAHASQRVYDLGDTGGEGSSQGSRRSAAGTVEGEDCSKLYMANVRIRKLEAELVLSHERCGRIAGLEDEMEAYTTMQDEKIREMQDQIRDLHSKLDAERQRNEQLAHKFSASEAMNRTPSLTGYLPVHPGDREDRMKERHAEPPIPLTRQSVSELASKFESKTTDRELTSSPRSRALLQTSATVMSGPEPLIQRVMNLYDSKGTTLYDSKGRTLHDVKSNQIQIDTFMKAPSSPAPQGDNDVYIMSTASSSYSGNAASLSQFGSALLPEHSRLQEEKNRSYNPTYSQNDCHHGVGTWGQAGQTSMSHFSQNSMSPVSKMYGNDQNGMSSLHRQLMISGSPSLGFTTTPVRGLQA